MDEYRILMEKFMNGDLAIVMWIMALMGLADLLIRLFFGLSGNYWYMRTCVSRVKRLRSKKPDMFPAELTAAGGTSFLLGASAYAILYFSSLLISTLIDVYKRQVKEHLPSPVISSIAKACFCFINEHPIYSRLTGSLYHTFRENNSREIIHKFRLVLCPDSCILEGYCKVKEGLHVS